MIKSSKQYRYSRRQLAGLTALSRRVDNMVRNFAIDQPHHIGVKANLDDVMQKLASDIDEYESMQLDFTDLAAALENFSSVPGYLIRARIAVGWSQCDLANAMNTHSAQISRYESSNYAAIRLDRAMAIAALLRQELVLRSERRKSPSVH